MFDTPKLNRACGTGDTANMNARSNRFLFCALVAIAAGLPLAARATVSSALSSVQPASSIVALGGTQSVLLRWNVTSLLSATGPYTVGSNGGSFVGADSVLGTVNTTLSGAGVATAIRTPTTVRVTEALTVPAEVTLRAHQLGASFIRFQRQFNDGSGSAFLDTTILIAGSGAAQLGITREALTFDDGSALRVVQRDEALSASAQISFTGAGSLRGAWEIAGPSSTPGQPQFRTLATVTLGLLGSGPEGAKSPPLPTDAPGYYVARLRITDPLPGFEAPQLQYYVGAAGAAHGGVTSMVLTGPGDGALFTDATRFSWQAVDGASAYQLELFKTPGTPAEAGVIVAAPRTEVVLSALARARLQPGSTYFWRVQAIGADGAVIGSAPARELRVP
jgi:hypothetical protein